MNRKLKLGLFGYGCVGQGLHDVLNSSAGFRADIVRICVKDRTKKRRLPMEIFTFDRDDILDDPEINLVVEMIDDAGAALEIVTKAMRNGKDVVTANKKMIADNLVELVRLQEETGSALLYEAAVCGSIPIIRNLEEYYDNELLYSVRGIFNGSSNFILSKMYNDGRDYDEVLREAQDLGYAETDPILDVGGVDAKYKLVIITLHAYGLFLKPEDVFNYGIQNISSHDIRYAREKGYKIKLVPSVWKVDESTIALYVLPRFITRDKNLWNVDYEYNGVIAEAAFSEKQFFYGKGAGGHPTGSAVLSDISANSYNYRYEYKKRNQGTVQKITNDVPVEIYLRYHNTEDFDKFAFESVSEQFYGPEFNYAIGVIRMNRLMAIEGLHQMDVFVVNTGKKFESYRMGFYPSRE